MDKPLPLQDLNILVVEDEAFIAMAIADELENAGASEITHAFTLAEAEQAVATKHFEVAILDLRLSDGTSSQLARDLVNLDTRIIFHSGHAEVEKLKLEFPKAGICHKPCPRHEFVKVIQRLLKT